MSRVPRLPSLRHLTALVLVASLLVPLPAAAADTASISGVVTLSDTGLPAEGACVTAWPGWSGAGRTPVEVAADGSYTIAGLAAGDWRLEASDCGATYGYVATWHDGSYGRSAAGDLVLAEDEQRTGVDIAMDPGGFIEGTVVSADPVMDPICLSATAAGPAGDEVVDVMWSASTYEIAGVPPGDWTVRFKDCNHLTNFAMQWYDGATSSLDAQTVTITGAGHRVTGIDAAMVPAGTVSGTVTAYEDDEPIADLCVEAWTDDDFSRSVQTRTDAEGAYTITELPQAEYVIAFGCGTDDDGWRPGWWRDNGTATVETGATPIEIAQDPVVDIDGVLREVPIAEQLNALEFVPLTPCALFDTRFATAEHLQGPHDHGAVLTFRGAGSMPAGQGGAGCDGPPETAVAVELNLVAVTPTAPGNLKVAPSGRTPQGGVVNFDTGQTNSNALPVRVDDQGRLDVHVNAGPTHVRGIALGYWKEGDEPVNIEADETPLGLEFVPSTPCAVYDSRTAEGDLGGARTGTTTISVTGVDAAAQGVENCVAGVPVMAQAAVVNVVAVAPTGTGNLRVAPAGTVPEGGVVNYDLGRTNSSAVPVRIQGGEIDVSVNGSATDVRVVLLGWFTAEEGVGLELVPVTACAVMDTRTATDVGPETTTRSFGVRGTPPLEAGGSDCEAAHVEATAVHLNVVAVTPDGGGNLRAAALGTEPEGGIVNYAGGSTNANAIPVAVSEDGQVEVTVNGAASHLRAVVVGAYVPADSGSVSAAS